MLSPVRYQNVYEYSTRIIEPIPMLHSASGELYKIMQVESDPTLVLARGFLLDQTALLRGFSTSVSPRAGNKTFTSPRILVLVLNSAPGELYNRIRLGSTAWLSGELQSCNKREKQTLAARYHAFWWS